MNSNTFWKIFKIGIVAQCIITLCLIIICIQIRAFDDKLSSPAMDHFVDIHAYDNFQVVIYPRTDKQKIYFCFEYKVDTNTNPSLITLYNMQGGVTDELRVPRFECEIFGTDINIDDVEAEE